MGEEQRLKRPLGVMILAILSILSGGSIIFQTTGFWGTTTFFEGLSKLSTFEQGLSLYGFFSAFLWVAIGGALFSGKRWGRTLTIIFTLIGLAIQVPIEIVLGGASWISIILGVIVIWYLRKPHVKAFFNQKTMQE